MSDFDVFAAAALADDEEPRRAPRSGSATCHNCAAPLSGPYCAVCGQRDQPLRIPLHRFLAQSLVEFFGVDGRVWRTLFALVFKPGTLTRDFLAGRRKRYLRPLRIYLSATLLFFFLLQLLDPVSRVEAAFGGGDVAVLDSTVTAATYLDYLDTRLEEEAVEVADYMALADSLQGAVDSVRAALDTTPDSLRADAEEGLDDLVDALGDARDDLRDVDGSLDDQRLDWQRAQVASFPPDSLIQPRDVDYAALLVVGTDETDINVNAPGWLSDARPFADFREARTSEERARAGADLARGSIGKVPVVLFLMLPLFALLLKVLYVRRGWYYSEHLVHGLHTHAFTFVVFTAVALIAAAAPENVFQTNDGSTGLGEVVSNLLLLMALPLYYLVSIKRVYGQGWIKSILKTSVLMTVYSMTLLVGGTVLAVILAAISG
ncbi:DUF3667 domain-containing protein [Rubrivirga sp. IMCC43871]|uniref:DUF3667 domain-containing protein n=1 Tax=Rubrivirga sp. IMCC43871 TaxID=3391575 RepID=UPI00398FF537